MSPSSQFWEEQLAEARRAGDSLWEADCLSFLANEYVRCGDMMKCIEYARRAAELREIAGKRQEAALAYLMVASAYDRGLGNLPAAIRYLEHALILASGDVRDQVEHYLSVLRQELGH